MSTSLLKRPAPAKKKSSAAIAKRQKAVDEQNVVNGLFQPDKLTWKNVDWTVLGWMVAMHAGCLFAPFYFTWQALAVTLVLYWLTASVGVCLGYHRYLAHRSFKLKSPAEFFVLLCGTVSGEGSPLTWAATHRLHHQRSDHDGDPHSPLHGKIWSHLTWIFLRHSKQEHQLLIDRYAPDLAARPMMQFFEKAFGPLLFIVGGILFLIGGLPMLLWGLCVRMVIAYHSTWFVNSATHLWGYRNYETTDESRNLWWVALLAFGEGWHNNHHAHPSVAPAGHRWWEFDATWQVIKFLRFAGLATDVKDRLPARGTTESAAA
jgi:stearoyl-CoA desaturase (delta-9 desaturase)